MIKKLKLKFILLSLSALFCLLLLVVAGMNVINYRSIISDADELLSMLSQNDGTFPGFDDSRFDLNGLPGSSDTLPDGSDTLPGGSDALPDGIADKLDSFKDSFKNHLSAETPYESRFFSVAFDDSLNVTRTDLRQIASVSQSEAVSYAKKALKDRDGQGFTDHYRYLCYSDSEGTLVTFLDCGRKLDTFYGFLLASSGMALGGYLIVLFVIIFFSGKILRPVAESYEKQKRFITDAGHEIKTPLTIINANADVLEMELGENEYLTDIQLQTTRLAALTNDLVYLARMEEQADSMPMIEFPVSDLVGETISSFKALAQTQNHAFELDIQPMLSMKGNSKAMEKLVSILMNNALKYASEGSAITVSLKQGGRQLVLSFANRTEAPVEPEKLTHVFERFYRADSSRNSETGGHGIGLSMAHAIVTAHGGKIQAWTRDGHSFGITASFPT